MQAYLQFARRANRRTRFALAPVPARPLASSLLSASLCWGPTVANLDDPGSTHGRRIDRRQFLAGGAAVLFAAWLPGRLAATTTHRGVDVQDLVEAAQRLNEAYLADGEPDEVSYLHELASVASRLGPVPRIELGPPFRNIMEIGFHHRGGGLVLIEWRMEARTVYPAHNHPSYNGFTLGLEGRCRIRNFQAPDRYPPTDSQETFIVRETQNAILAPGRIASMMSTDRDNIHKLHAGDAAVRGLDVTTLVDEHRGFGFIDIDEASRSSEGNFEAVWERILGGYEVD